MGKINFPLRLFNLFYLFIFFLQGAPLCGQDQAKVIGLLENGILINRGAEVGVTKGAKGKIYYIETVSGKKVNNYIVIFLVESVESQTCQALITKKTKDPQIGNLVDFTTPLLTPKSNPKPAVSQPAPIAIAVEPSLEQLIADGDNAFDARRFALALDLFKRAYNKDQNNIVLKNKIENTDNKLRESERENRSFSYYEQADKYLTKGNIESVFLTLVKAIQEIPAERSTIFQKIEALLKENLQQINNVMTANDEQFKQMGDDVAALMASIYLKNSNIDKSLEYLKTIKDRSRMVECIKNDFELFDKSGKLDQVDRRGEIYFEMGLLYRQKGDFKRAGKLLKYSLKKGISAEAVFDKIGVSKLVLNIYKQDPTLITGALFSERFYMNQNGYPEAIFANNTILVYIPEGDFSKKEFLASTKQIHADSFWMQKFEISVRQYQAFRSNANEANVSYLNEYSSTEQHPITLMAWKDANDYCSWLTDQTGLDFRLPLSVEWEKAATGPSRTKKYPWGDADYDSVEPAYSNFSGDEDGFEYASPVNSFENGRSFYGIFNLLGNVWEWAHDGAYAELKSVFGGSWSESPQRIVNSIRMVESAKKYKDVGFRVVMTSR